MPLREMEIRNAKPAAKSRRLFDGGGLYLEIAPSGGKWWRLKYRVAGKEKRLSFGVYPTVTLAAAREAREDARRLLTRGVDPSLQRRAQKQSGAEAAANSFSSIAREWLDKNRAGWVAKHAEKVERRLENDIFPWLGTRPIGDIDAPTLLACIRRIESRGALETAHRALQNCGQVFRYAVATGRAARDPSGDLRGALPPLRKQRHFASITDPAALGELLRAIDAYAGSFVTRCALKLAPLVFVRPGELRHGEWSEFNLEAAEWRIPAVKMKARSAHIVPLSTQAVAILREIHPLTGRARYVFPGEYHRDRPMSENTVLAALRRLGYSGDQMTGHGFRSTASTLLHEMGWKGDIIERQLAHAERNKVKAAYNHAEYLPERRKMMQSWADYLDAIRSERKVITGNFGRTA